MDKATITFRTDEERKNALDVLARSQQRNRSFLINEAIDNYLDVQGWQIQHIEAGLAQAKRGQFASSGQVTAKFDKLRNR